MTIYYRLGANMYVNVTNECSCSCVFCIRNISDGVGSADSLWLPREPGLHEMKDAFDNEDLSGVSEIVFCGYGEPMERAADVLALCEHMRQHTKIPLRLNTNGLARLIDPDFHMPSLKILDRISISLNAHNAAEYTRLSRPRFGEAAFDAMLDFARQAKAHTAVTLTVVDTPDGPNIPACQSLADSLGIELRVR